MAICPKCATEFSAEFGMSKCPNCQALVFVDLEGKPQVGEVEPPPVSPVTGVSEAVEPTGSEILPNDSGEVEIPVPEPPSVALSDEPLGQGPVGFPSLPEDRPEPVDAGPKMPEEEMLPIESLENSLTGSRKPGSVPELEEIADYGNAEISQGRDGYYRYTLKVSGVDSREIREAMHLVFCDHRLNWDVDEVWQKLEHGVMLLAGLSAVKTSVIVQGLKTLPLKISWEQHAITELEND